MPKRKVLKTRQTLFEEGQGGAMKYEPVALTYSGITMEMLNLMGIDIKEVATSVIEFAKRNTLSKDINANLYSLVRISHSTLDSCNR